MRKRLRKRRNARTKPQEQQDIQALHRLRERTVKERTARANQIRGLLAEYGIVIQLGIAVVRQALPEILKDGDNGLTPGSRLLRATA